MFGTQTGSITAAWLFELIYSRIPPVPVAQCCRASLQVQASFVVKLPCIGKRLTTNPSHMITEEVGQRQTCSMCVSGFWAPAV